MITLEKAYDMVKAEENEVIYGTMETEDTFVFSVGKGREAYTTVNKFSGEMGVMWIWEAFELADKKIIHKVDKEEVRIE